MADYWKSTPKYWCKHCSMYVVDTKVSRTNHDATGKHQSAVKRALRDLHRDHERQEREKERAKREVDRLNGIVGGESSKSNFTRKPAQQPQAQAQGAPPVAQTQLEQLVDLGVSIPDEFRGGLAMAGDWTVTETRIIEDPETAKKNGSNRAVGVRKRPLGDGDDDTRPGGHSEFEKLDVDAAVQGLFKKPRTWGRDSRTVAGAADGDLDSLLSIALKPKTEVKEVKEEVKKEAKVEEADIKKEVKEEAEPEANSEVKAEADDDSKVKIEAPQAESSVKQEDVGGLDLPSAPQDAKPEEPAIVFKKRKSKASRQK